MMVMGWNNGMKDGILENWKDGMGKFRSGKDWENGVMGATD